MPNNRIMLALTDSVISPNRIGKPFSSKEQHKTQKKFKQQKEVMSKTASEAIKSEALASIVSADMENAKSEIKTIKDRAYKIYASDIAKKMYRNAMEDYHEVKESGFQGFCYDSENVVKQYSKKTDPHTGHETIIIREYEDNKIRREAIIPTDFTSPVVVSERNYPFYETCSFYKGKLYKYEHGEYDKEYGKRTHEVFKYRVLNGTLAGYYKDIKQNGQETLNIGQKYEFDSYGELINYQCNLENIDKETESI